MSDGKNITGRRAPTTRKTQSDGSANPSESVALIEALYTLSDITAEINGRKVVPPMGLTSQDDIGLIDDIIDALQDRTHGEFARDALRDAVARIARHSLPDQ